MTKLINPASISLETKEAPCHFIAIHQPLHCQKAETEVFFRGCNIYGDVAFFTFII